MPAILNINNYHYRRGGADAVYFDHAALMADQGWQTGFFSMHHPRNQPSEWSPYFIDELELGGDYSIGQKLVRATKVVYSFEARRKLKNLLGVFRADVAHLHNIYHHLSPAILPVLKQAGVPVVMTAHDLKIACPSYKMLTRDGVCERCKGGNYLNTVRQRCVQDSLAASVIVAAESTLHGWLSSYRNNVDKFVVPSRFFAQKFVEWGWPASKFEYIPNFIDTDRFAPDFTPGDYFLYVGRISAEKGLPTLVDAAIQSRVNLKIAGTGPMESALKAKYANQPGVEFLGFRSGEELHQIIRRSRALVLPSEWYENAPLSVLEALALGKPVIGARIGGIPEMIDDGHTGWLFESGDRHQLAEALERTAATSDSSIRQMGQAGRQIVQTNFSKARYLEAMMALYASLGVKNASESVNKTGKAPQIC